MLEDLKQNIEGLVALYENERHRADALDVKLKEAESLVKEYKTQIINLNEQIDNLKLTYAFKGPDTRVSRERLDKLIREIDKCISLLEKEE